MRSKINKEKLKGKNQKKIEKSLIKKYIVLG